MLFKNSYSFFYRQKVAYFVHKLVDLICSNPTYLRCIADQTRSKYDQPTLYRRPPRCTPAQHTTCGERDHPRPFFQPVEKLIPLTTTSQRGPDQPRCILDQHTLSPIKACSLPIHPFFQSGRERGLIGSLAWTGLYEKKMCFFFIPEWCWRMYIKKKVSVINSVTRKPDEWFNLP